METVVCDIAKTRMEKEFNEALHSLGLLVSSIRFVDTDGLSVVIELTCDENVIICAS